MLVVKSHSAPVQLHLLLVPGITNGSLSRSDRRVQRFILGLQKNDQDLKSYSAQASRQSSISSDVSFLSILVQTAPNFSFSVLKENMRLHSQPIMLTVLPFLEVPVQAPPPSLYLIQASCKAPTDQSFCCLLFENLWNSLNSENNNTLFNTLLVLLSSFK